MEDCTLQFKVEIGAVTTQALSVGQAARAFDAGKRYGPTSSASNPCQLAGWAGLQKPDPAARVGQDQGPDRLLYVLAGDKLLPIPCSRRRAANADLEASYDPDRPTGAEVVDDLGGEGAEQEAADGAAPIGDQEPRLAGPHIRYRPYAGRRVLGRHRRNLQRVLHLRAHQQAKMSGIASLLQPQARRRQTTHPGRPCPVPPGKARQGKGLSRKTIYVSGLTG